MNITLNDTITVNGADGKATEQSIASWSPEFMAYLLAYAHGVRMQRCTASVDKEDHLKTRQAMFDSMAAGEVPSGGGGGGPRLSVEDAGRIAYYNSKGSAIKIKGQVANGKNLTDYDNRFVKKAIWASLREDQTEFVAEGIAETAGSDKMDKAALTALTEALQRKYVVEQVPGIVQDNLEATLHDAMQDVRPAMMGDFVESEKRKRAGTTAPTFTAKAVIKRK